MTHGHGGRRPLTFAPDTGNVWDSGRRGRRRVRTDECTRLTAEQVYTDLLASDPARVHPGAYGWVETVIEGVRRSFAVEVRAHAVWRHGRLFLRCPWCGARCTRLYLPHPRGAGPACRRCLGLTYESRATRTYRDTPRGRGAFGRMWGVTQRDSAYMETSHVRQRRAEACAERWAYRRALLRTP